MKTSYLYLMHGKNKKEIKMKKRRQEEKKKKRKKREEGRKKGRKQREENEKKKIHTDNPFLRINTINYL